MILLIYLSNVIVLRCMTDGWINNILTNFEA